MTDTPLTEEGRREAESAGKMLAEHSQEFDAGMCYCLLMLFSYSIIVF
jgi:broad specificity phosphatase PhoE